MQNRSIVQEDFPLKPNTFGVVPLHSIKWLMHEASISSTSLYGKENEWDLLRHSSWRSPIFFWSNSIITSLSPRSTCKVQKCHNHYTAELMCTLGQSNQHTAAVLKLLLSMVTCYYEWIWMAVCRNFILSSSSVSFDCHWSSRYPFKPFPYLASEFSLDKYWDAELHVPVCLRLRCSKLSSRFHGQRKFTSL